MAQREKARTKVYYNAACPVCDAGIKMQRRKLESRGAAIDWIDVHTNKNAVAEIGGDLEFVRERLHVMDRDGQLKIGAEAFVAIWGLTPGQGALVRLGGLPVLRTLFRWAYNLFAAVLYRWNRWHRRW